MKLLVIVLCLLSERFLMHSISYQRFSWFPDYAQKILALTNSNEAFKNSWLQLGILILPILIPTLIIYALLHNIIFGLFGFILSIVLFFYCLGPQNAFYPLAEKTDEEGSNNQVGNYFAQANNQLFAVIFWYIIAGPIAALTYRLLTLSQTILPVSVSAKTATDVLEWVPARLTVLLYLLVGNFQRGFSLFLQYILAKPESNNDMLSQCGLQAVRSNPTEEVPMPVAETLVEHACVVLLVFIALFTLVAWM